MRLASLFAVCFCVLLIGVASSWGESQSFDDAASAASAGWTGKDNTPAGGLGLDLGWSDSNIAGGTAGEAGGTITWRSPGIGYYADITGIALTQGEVLHAEGRLTIDSMVNPDGAFELGWFNESQGPGSWIPYYGGKPDFIGIRFAEPKEDPPVAGRAMLRVGASQSDERPEILTVGNDFLFTLDYDPHGDGPNVGKLALRIADAADPGTYTDVTLGGIAWDSENLMTLDAFGMLSCDILDQTRPGAEFYIDDLTYTATSSNSAMLPGDANNDGIVNDLDAVILAENWQGGPGKIWSQGDFNDDTYVNDIDATILAANWSTAAGGASVPEPGMIGLIIGGLFALLAYSNRRASRRA